MDLTRVAAGALTGFVVGLTGVGGGALMTPMLLLIFGAAPLTAVGTDLWFAAITKVAISGLHYRAQLIDWAIVRTLWLGSLSASMATLLLLRLAPAVAAPAAVTTAVGIAICISALGLLAQPWLQSVGRKFAVPTSAALRQHQYTATVVAGALLGVLVTLTSVGAGALGAVTLFYLYPSRLTLPRLIATDVAHAIPLAVFAGIGHLWIGSVDAVLLRDLLLGSIPAGVAGTLLSSRLPHRWLRLALAVVLLAVGVKLLAGVGH